MSDDPRWGSDPRDRRDDVARERDDDDALALGRGPGSTGPRDDHSGDDPRRRDDGSGGLERDRDKGLDPRDVFMRDLALPRGLTDRSSTMPGTASTPYGVRRLAPCRPLARFGSSRDAIFVTTTGVLPIHAQATCATSGTKASSEPRSWPVIGTWRSS